LLRLRPGSALSTFTRLVFDLSGSGLPAIVVTRPDDLHLVVTFQNTTGANVPLNGVHSIQVAGVEHAVQEGADLVITIDLKRPVRPVVFTMAPSGGHPFRLVLDLYSS
jgi:N-acetylmuramoyl-L-alanine amidase